MLAATNPGAERLMRQLFGPFEEDEIVEENGMRESLYGRIKFGEICLC